MAVPRTSSAALRNSAADASHGDANKAVKVSSRASNPPSASATPIAANCATAATDIASAIPRGLSPDDERTGGSDEQHAREHQVMVPYSLPSIPTARLTQIVRNPVSAASPNPAR